MTTIQKIIKYLALAFATFLIISIVSGILLGIKGAATILEVNNSDNSQTMVGESRTIDYEEDEDIASLKIKLKYSKLIIKEGENLLAVTNNKYINSTQNKNQIEIEEKGNDWFKNNNESQLILYVPKNTKFETVKIETGAGEIEIKNLETEKLKFELGAGKAEMENLIVSKEAKIEGGAGKVDILSGTINDLDLEMGIGTFDIKAKLVGNNKIEAGIGQLNIELEDDIENYTIQANKGIGNIRIKGKEISDNTKYGIGENYIKIEGGIGSIKIM